MYDRESNYAQGDADDPFPTLRRPRPFVSPHPLGDPSEVERFLAQGERWVTAGGPVDVDGMTPEHALNATALILANAARIGLTRYVGALIRDTTSVDELVVRNHALGDARIAVYDEYEARHALLDMTLVAALVERARAIAAVRSAWER